MPASPLARKSVEDDICITSCVLRLRAYDQACLPTSAGGSKSRWPEVMCHSAGGRCSGTMAPGTVRMATTDEVRPAREGKIETVSGLPPLFPRIASFLYLAVLVAHLYYWGAGLCGDAVSPVQTGVVIGLLGLLLAAESYAASPRLLAAYVWMPIALLAAR